MTATRPDAPTLSEALAAFADGVTFDALPPAVGRSVKQRVLDTVGVSLAAAGYGLGDGVAALLDRRQGAPASSLIARGAKAPAAHAALYNGTLAHALDFDDTHLPSILHPSASVIPAALATAEAQASSGAETLAAAAAGIEVAVRTGMGGYLAEAGNVFFERGWHATSVCGTLGSAVTVAKLLGLGRDGILAAIGIATSMASGIIEANRAGGNVKRLHCGWAAHAGTTAAELAAAGFTGPRTALEGRFGFYQAFLAGQFDPTAVTEGLGQHWELPGIVFKPYPTNHFTHAAIDAAMAIRRKYPLDAARITRIEYGTGSAPLRTIGEPRPGKIRPLSGYHALFSGPFTVAAALLGGGGLGVYFDDFTDEKARDPRLLALAAKVEMFVDEVCDRDFPRLLSAVLRVEMEDGAFYEERIAQSRGGPANPLSEDELTEKFLLNAGQCGLGRSQADDLEDAVLSLDDADEVGSVLARTLPSS